MFRFEILADKHVTTPFQFLGFEYRLVLVGCELNYQRSLVVMSQFDDMIWHGLPGSPLVDVCFGVGINQAV